MALWLAGLILGDIRAQEIMCGAYRRGFIWEGTITGYTVASLPRSEA